MTYKLLTPGPLSTSESVKEAMLVDHCTWDEDYKTITQWIRQQLLEIGGVTNEEYTTILMQGSGSFGVESVISSVIKPDDCLLVCSNGAYGKRMITMCKRHKIDFIEYHTPEDQIPNALDISRLLMEYPEITAIAMVHSETTSGILNDLPEIAAVAKKQNLTFIVDAMSSFGGIQIPIKELGIDYLISSANKCIQGVPGFSFIIAQREALEKSRGNARTLSLDLYDQYQTMEKDGKWRFTSPTHTVLAFQQALIELAEEGGVDQRYLRYLTNNLILRRSMEELGFIPYIKEHQGPFITSFLYPTDLRFSFEEFYNYLKQKGFVIYPGKISEVDCFRIGNIGDIYPEDMEELAEIITTYLEDIYVY